VALLEPSFRLGETAAARCEESHQRILDGSVTEITPIELFEINAEFHEMLAASTHNRFFLEAIRQQNRLRRFGNYHWVYGPERAIHVCREHMSILQAVRSGNMTWASTLMRHHLEASATNSPYSEGAPAPQRIIRFG
jgi:DNA-binding GntR family transcriptional regulator